MVSLASLLETSENVMSYLRLPTIAHIDPKNLLLNILLAKIITFLARMHVI